MRGDICCLTAESGRARAKRAYAIFKIRSITLLKIRSIGGASMNF